MKRLIIIPFLILSIICNAETYYVAPATATPAGNDSNAGTIAAPWRTWNKAFHTADAGDTVFFRGGVYPMYPTDGHGIYYSHTLAGYGNQGTRANPIVYMAYPPDHAAGNHPILDGSNITSPSYSFMRVMQIYGVDFIEFNGLHFRNFKQTASEGVGSVVDGIQVVNRSNNVIWKNCVAYNFGGNVFFTHTADTVYYINCDAYNTCDSLGHLPGNYGTGFATQNPSYMTGLVSYKGCRAWRCSDQGYASGGSRSLVKYDSCWSFSNGALPGTGGGLGWKLGYMSDTAVAKGVDVMMTNCIAAFNKQCGISTNDNDAPAQNMLFYNNIVYYNGRDPLYTTNRYGFITYSNSTGAGVATFRNNISYDNYYTNLFKSTAVHSNNNWDIPLTLRSSDFVSLDSAGMTAARQANGSLPNNDFYNQFMKLADGSQAIDRGVDVGITFIGEKPDLGAFEYFYEEDDPYTVPLISTMPPFNVSIHQGASGGYAISDGGAAITVKGICWSTSVDPTVADSKTESGSGEGSFTATIAGLSSNTTYHVRAYATNSEGTGYGNDVSFTTPNSGMIWGESLDKVVFQKSTGKIVIIK
jgi:hypothetical protein